MSNTFRLSRDFNTDELARFSRTFPGNQEVVVQRRVRSAAEARLVALARDLNFETQRPMVDCLFHVARKNRELLRLSRSPVDAEDWRADVAMA